MGLAPVLRSVTFTVGPPGLYGFSRLNATTCMGRTGEGVCIVVGSGVGVIEVGVDEVEALDSLPAEPLECWFDGGLEYLLIIVRLIAPMPTTMIISTAIANNLRRVGVILSSPQAA